MATKKAYLGAASVCAVVVAAALAAPMAASAQETPPTGPLPSTQPGQPGASPPSVSGQRPPPPPSGSEGPQTNELVVTGSRIKTDTYNSPAPMTVITSEQATLTANVDTTQILQMLPVAANASQVNNYYSGYEVTGGPGINTLSLRGLGAQRTLILLNGQRMGPAGATGTVDPVDLNTIPESQIDHIDILKDGASSIYGSDAVAGVVNIVTKTTQDGGDLRVTALPSQYGGGNVYQVDGSYGKTWSKGYATVGFDIYRQDPLTVSQRSYLNCSTDLVGSTPAAAGSGNADIINPNTGQDKCWNSFVNGIEDLAQPFGNVYIPNAKAVAGGGYGYDLPGWQAVGLQLCGNPAVVCGTPGASSAINAAATRVSQGLIPENSPQWEQNQAITPDTRYTFTFFGGYDLTPHAQIYTSVLLNQRNSSQLQPAQFFGYGNPGSVYNPGFYFPLPIIQEVEPSTQQVNYFRGVLGIKGDIPPVATFKNWTYDLYGQYSLDDASYTQVYEKADRVNATLWATDGCDPNAISPFIGGKSLAQAEPGVACVPVNYFQATANGGFTPAESAFLFSKGTGHTTYNHMYVEGSATGDILPIWAGEIGGAIGFQLRRETIDDNPGPDFINGNVYNYSTSGITRGSEDVEEAFGEIRIPLAKGLPLIYAADLDLSGRFSNYSTYGGNFTYKATATWRLTDWFELRGTYGTAFRAPALYELYLADQTGYYLQQEIDPCINYGTSGVSPTIKKNCASQGIPPTYQGLGPSALILSGGGAGHLKAETSIAETGGFVLTPHFWGQDFRVALDYYSFDIVNQIQQFGVANILDQCYSASNFPNNPFCSLFMRDLTPGSNFGNITQVNNDYVNVAKEVDQGLDLDATYNTRFWGDYKLTVDGSFAWTFYTQTNLLGGSINNYLGSIGLPAFVGTTDFKLDKGPWTVNWFVQVIGPTNDAAFTSTTIYDYRGTGQTAYASYKTPFYSLNTFTVQRRFDKFTLTGGIKNIFNVEPPPISAFDSFEAPRVGVSPALISQYDLVGRTFYIQAEAKF